MSDNKALWKRAFTTDPTAVKPITGKPYKGNSPKPYWLIERATEEFGPIGVGWGVDVKSERFERVSDTDVLHVAVVSVWYVHNGVRSQTFDQMGGTKAVYAKSDGKLIVDEDAGKKSVTDGMVKCLSMIGFAGDIFSGMWDDSKYVEHAGQVWSQAREEERRGFDGDREAELQELALYLIDCHRTGKETDAIRMFYATGTWNADNTIATEEQKFVWGLLKHESALRSMLKANSPRLKAA